MRSSTALLLALSCAALLSGTSHSAWATTKLSRKQAIAQKLAPLPPASEQQLAASKLALIGRYVCELGQEITVDLNDANPGYLNLKHKNQLWIMKPVLSTTGALRIEDTRGQTLLVQTLTKSMLLDVKKGQRIVDGCVHEVQQRAQADLDKQPARGSLLDSPR